MTTLAVIGLGAMGSRIARRLLEAGHDIVVWNRSPGAMDALIDLGATPAVTPADATVQADAVLTVVSDPSALRDVTEGAVGVSAAADASTTVIQMSTVQPQAVARLASMLPASAGLLDAPVLGSLSEAESGSLRVFIGGPEALIARWTPELSALGTLVHVGTLGAGTAAKLVANSTLLTVLGQLAESLSLAQALDLPRDVAFGVLSATPLAAQAERRRRAVETGEYPLHFSLALARKDANLILDAAEAAGADLRLASAVRTWFADADDAGWGERDYSSILAYVLGSG